MWIISVIIILEACPGSVPLSSYPVEGLLGSGTGRDLHVAGLLPVTGGWPGGGAMLAAIDIALEYVNMQEDLLPGYTLKVIYNDSQFRVNEGVHALHQMLTSPPTKMMVLAAANSELSQATALISELWNLVQVSYASVTPALSDKSTYPFFFRTAAPDTAINPARMEIMRTFGWKKAATLHEARAVFDAVVEDLERQFTLDNVTLLTSEVFQNDPYPQIQNLKKHDARVIFAVSNKPKALRILCEAYKAGLYGPKYVWFFPGWLDKYWWRQNTGGCTVEQMDAAAEGYISPGAVTLNPEDQATLSGLTPTQFLAIYNKRTNYTTPLGTNMMPQAFDAIWAMAVALNNTQRLLMEGSAKRLHDFRYGDTEMATMIRESMRSVAFEGIMAPFVFDENHDPIVMVKLTRVQNGRIETVGIYRPVETNGSHIEWMQETPIVWRGGRKPVDSNTILFRKVLVPLTLYTVGSALATVGIVMSLSFLFINVKFRETRLIKMSSPNINNIILSGCAVMYSSVYLQQLDVHHVTSICMAKGFTFVVGFSLVFGALFSKTWRIHKIFANKQMKMKVVKDSHLVAMVMGLLVVDFTVLVLWYTVDPLYVTTYNYTLTTLEQDTDVLVQEQKDTCESRHQVFYSGTLLAIQGLLLFFAAFLAFETRKVDIPALNDSKHIGMCVYNVFILSAVTVVMSYAIEDNVTLHYIMISAFVILGTTTTQCILFVPKISKLREVRVSGDAEDAYTKSSIQKTGGTATGEWTDTSSSEDARLKLAEAQKAILEKDKVIAELRDQLAFSTRPQAP